MTQATRADWEARASQLRIEGRAFIDGQEGFSHALAVC